MITKRKDIAMLQEARQFIEENFSKDIRIGKLCREFGLNRTKLQEGFNQLFGLPVHAFISQVRMNKARALLTETDESVKAIAMEIGYKSVGSFTRIFTKQHAASPTQYRTRLLSNSKQSEKTGRLDN